MTTEIATAIRACLALPRIALEAHVRLSAVGAEARLCRRDPMDVKASGTAEPLQDNLCISVD